MSIINSNPVTVFTTGYVLHDGTGFYKASKKSLGQNVLEHLTGKHRRKAGTILALMGYHLLTKVKKIVGHGKIFQMFEVTKIHHEIEHTHQEGVCTSWSSEKIHSRCAKITHNIPDELLVDGLGPILALLTGDKQ